MKKTSELISLPIFSISQGQEYGKAREVLIDAANGIAILVLEMDEKDWYLGAKLLPFESIVGIGESVLVINNSKDILPIAERKDFISFFEADVKVIGTKVLTKTGKIIGKVIEFFVDKAGKIQICEVEEPTGTIIQVPLKNIITFGKEVLFISDLDEEGTAFIPAGIIEQTNEIAVQEPPFTPESGFVQEETTVADLVAPAPETAPVEEVVVAPPEIAAEPIAPIPEVTIVEPPQLPPETPTVVETPPAPKADDSAKSLDNKRRELLIGKKASKRIESDNGVLIIEKNAVVTEEVLQKATLTNKLKELYLNVL